MEYSMSESEQIIMAILWNHPSWMTISEISDELQQEHNISWKRQTINTFLARLMKKNLVCQNGRQYTCALSQNEYAKLKAETILKTEYNGSLKNFIVALSGSQHISKQEYEDLIRYLDSFK